MFRAEQDTSPMNNLSMFRFGGPVSPGIHLKTSSEYEQPRLTFYIHHNNGKLTAKQTLHIHDKMLNTDCSNTGMIELEQ